MDGSTAPVDKASKETPTQPSTGDSSEVKRGVARRKVQSISRAWTHFTKILDAKGDVIGAQCKHFEKQYACHTKRNGTSSLLAHMSSCMKNSENVDASQSLINVQPGKEGVVGSSSISAWKYNYGEIRESIAYMICSDELPFKFVESRGFKIFMSKACPRFKIPSRTTVTEIVLICLLKKGQS
ncbi:HAT family dimerisation domain containing protein [Striga asiatica]|uniref:HAT family dimerisation domain containing protein n=1 Tax=Striga asiatica TaxID=4170 RepID=A0A5A7PDW1_STRAF|nr:HAT family dimerisation domain containing protein [Striga asiatica]